MAKSLRGATSGLVFAAAWAMLTLTLAGCGVGGGGINSAPANGEVDAPSDLASTLNLAFEAQWDSLSSTERASICHVTNDPALNDIATDQMTGDFMAAYAADSALRSRFPNLTTAAVQSSLDHVYSSHCNSSGVGGRTPTPRVAAPEVPPPVSVDSPDPSGWSTYADVDGDSGVSMYQSGPGYLWVQFDDGSQYLYTEASAGATDVARMQQLATAGDGLNAYINAYARYDYAAKR